MVIDLFSITPPLHHPNVPCRACTAFVSIGKGLKQHRSVILDTSNLHTRIAPRGSVTRGSSFLAKEGHSLLDLVEKRDDLLFQRVQRRLFCVLKGDGP